MATLQKLRNMGPLLVIFVGLALFAFVAGDAVRLFDTRTSDTVVGTIGDDEIDIMEYQELRNEFDCYLEEMNYSGIPEEARQANIWNIIAQDKQFRNLANELGITVTAEEINHVLTNGKSAFVIQGIPQNSRFRNGNNINMPFLSELTNSYNEMTAAGQMSSELAKAYAAWQFIKKAVETEILQAKVNAIVADATIANPAVLKKNFDLNNNTHTANIAFYPFENMDIKNVEVTEEEIADSYAKEKASNPAFMNEQDSRDITYIIKQVVPSQKDLQALEAEMTRYADTLKNGYDNYERLARISRSVAGYSALLHTKNVFAPVIAEKIDTLPANKVLGPVEIEGGYGVFMNIEKATAPETFKMRAIIVSELTQDGKKIDAAAVVDSLANILNKKADFKAVSSNYPGSFDDDQVFETSNPNHIMGICDDIETQKAIYNAPVGKYQTTDITLQVFNAKMLFCVTEKTGKTDVFHTIAIIREKVFSNETYNEEYDKFCKFVGSCTNSKELAEKAIMESENEYWTSTEKGITTDAVSIANVAKTKDFIDWLFNEETKVGQISDVKKCNSDDVFMAIALDNINLKGYKPADTEVRPGVTINDMAKDAAKKSKATMKAIEEMKGKSYAELKNNTKISTSTIDKIEFKNDANITPSKDEAAVSAVVAKMNAGEISEPFEGKYGVYVVEVVSKNAKNETFNATAEKQEIEAMYNKYLFSNIINKTLNKIYPKENRTYKFF